MKIIHTGGKRQLQINLQEWTAIGAKTGWLKTAEDISTSELYCQYRAEGQKPEAAAQQILDILTTGVWAASDEQSIQSYLRQIIESYEPIFQSKQPALKTAQAKSHWYALETKQPVPLKNGTYKGLHYGYCVEIEGKTYATKDGVRCMREHCGGPKPLRIEDGKVFAFYEAPQTRQAGIQKQAARPGDWPHPYGYEDEYGFRKNLLPHPEDAAPEMFHDKADAQAKGKAAVEASRNQRIAWLRKALNAMNQAGEWDVVKQVLESYPRWRNL